MQIFHLIDHKHNEDGNDKSPTEKKVYKDELAEEYTKDDHELHIHDTFSYDIGTPESQYKNTMDEIKARFSEFKLLDND